MCSCALYIISSPVLLILIICQSRENVTPQGDVTSLNYTEIKLADACYTASVFFIKSNTPLRGICAFFTVSLYCLCKCLPLSGDSSVRCEQLDLLLEWGSEFRRANSGSADEEKVLEDQVAFDVVLGDLNFDNCSSGKSVIKYNLQTKGNKRALKQYDEKENMTV